MEKPLTHVCSSSSAWVDGGRLGCVPLGKREKEESEEGGKRKEGKEIKKEGGREKGRKEGRMKEGERRREGGWKEE
ncbi:hypothetical protein E2320_013097 [Naja naja]|nr:hypothetical protein E2320_013097 [Naja naja]